MLERILIAIITALFNWLQARAERPQTAKDADRRADLLHELGRRVRQWEDRAGAGGRADAHRAEHERPGVRDD